MSKGGICAVIPAAGRGTRLGIDVPKILAPLAQGLTIWDVLYSKLASKVDHIHVILSPSGLTVFQEALKKRNQNHSVSYSIQQDPIGMGDAIFQGYSVWSQYSHIVIVWGDQVFLSDHTIQKIVQSQLKSKSQTLTLPLASQAEPYVEYIFDEKQKLVKVLQSREGDHCHPDGMADVGAFGLTVEGLFSHWKDYLSLSIKGQATKEVNFLPFFPFLSCEKKWNVEVITVKDPDESRGVNTLEDLEYFKKRGELNV